MREVSCAVPEPRLDPDGTQERLQAIRKVRGEDFDPEEGFEWPFPERDEDGEEVVVR